MVGPQWVRRLSFAAGGTYLMTSKPAAGALLACSVLTLSGATAADIHAPRWPDTAATRLEAQALLETLNADLLSHPSATLVLDKWCARHGLAEDPHIMAERVHGAVKTPDAEVLKLLDVASAEDVRYRRVRLTCGRLVLSEADNWYVPARLTPEMNKTLEATDISFGRVIHPLNFRRRTLSSKQFWHPLPEGWEIGVPLPTPTGEALQIPHALLEHRAVLSLPDGTPLSLVVETYTSNVLAFPPPSLTPEGEGAPG
jgi:hypothetical protein